MLSLKSEAKVVIVLACLGFVAAAPAIARGEVVIPLPGTTDPSPPLREEPALVPHYIDAQNLAQVPPLVFLSCHPDCSPTEPLVVGQPSLPPEDPAETPGVASGGDLEAAPTFVTVQIPAWISGGASVRSLTRGNGLVPAPSGFGLPHTPRAADLLDQLREAQEQLGL